MKIKYRVKSNLIPGLSLMIIATIKILLNVFYSQPILSIFLILLLVFLILYIINVVFFFRIIINSEFIESKFYFIKKKIYFIENPEITIKPFFKVLRKRLIIKSRHGKIVVWDFYDKSLEDIKRYIDSSL
jgi:hypothetical protein